MKRILAFFLLLILLGQGAMAQNKKEQIAILQHEVDSLTGRVEMLDKQLAQSINENERLSQLLEERTNENKRLSQALEERTDDLNQRTQELASVRQTVEQLQKSLKEAQEAQQKLQRESDARIAELNQEIASLSEALGAYTEIADEPADESEIFTAVYEIIISGHPKYAKAMLSQNGLEEGEGNNALVNFYDRNGNLVKTYEGEGGWNSKGFLASFDNGKIEIGVSGLCPDGCPTFTDHGKEYNIKIIE